LKLKSLLTGLILTAIVFAGCASGGRGNLGAVYTTEQPRASSPGGAAPAAESSRPSALALQLRPVSDYLNENIAKVPTNNTLALGSFFSKWTIHGVQNTSDETAEMAQEILAILRENALQDQTFVEVSSNDRSAEFNISFTLRPRNGQVEMILLIESFLTRQPVAQQRFML
jgi:hypothetical protein